MNDFLEKTLEDIIMDNKTECVKRGFPFISPSAVRQYKLKNGKILDILSADLTEKKYSIFELKKGYLDIPSAIQILKYEIDLMNDLTEFGKPSLAQIELILVGREIDENLALLVLAGLQINIILYKYDVDGIRFYKYPPDVSQNKIQELRQGIQTNGLPEPECAGIRSETGLQMPRLQ